MGKGNFYHVVLHIPTFDLTTYGPKTELRGKSYGLFHEDIRTLDLGASRNIRASYTIL